MMQRKTPLMGWASWNCFRTNISEIKIKEQADALIHTGLAQHGYDYLNIDDGFFGGRSSDGTLLSHKERFPNGVKVIASYAHDLHLKAGIYSDAGDNTCGFYYDNEGKDGANVGLYGFEEQDLHTYLVDWGFDFIKVDWCGGLRLGLDEKEQYTKIANIIERIRLETGKSIVYNICSWKFPGEWATQISDSWRTGADIYVDFKSVIHQIDAIKPLRNYCKPGHVNDLDMLQIGNGMSQGEDESHFIMWCMMSTPLMIGCDLTQIQQQTLNILTNDELISINQDPACLQAFVVKSFYDRDQELAAEVWVKDLAYENSCEKAVAFLNRSEHNVTITVELYEIGLGGEIFKIREIVTHTNLETTSPLSISIAPHCCKAYRILGQYPIPISDNSTPAK